MIISDNGEEFTRVSSDKLVEKTSSPGPTITEPEAGITGIDFNQGWSYPSAGVTITPPGGSSAQIRARGQAQIYGNCVPFVTGFRGIRFNDSWSRSEWLGSSPYRATSITHKVIWRTSGISLGGITVASAPSGSVIPSAGRVEWTTTQNNIWWIERGDNDVRFNAGWGTFSAAHYDLSGSFQFGSSYFRGVNSYSSKSLTVTGC